MATRPAATDEVATPTYRSVAAVGRAPAETAGRGLAAPRSAGSPGLAASRRELTERAGEWARGSRAGSTWRAYETRWERFVRWCAEHDECAYPADPLTICRFLADLAPQWRRATPADPVAAIVVGHVLVRFGMRPGTVAGYLAAISVAHQADAWSTATPAATLTALATSGPPGGQLAGGHAVSEVTATVVAGQNPARHEMVRRVLAGIARHPTVSPPRRRTALRPADLRAALAPLAPEERLADARDAALLLVGWKGALRTDDLGRLDITDLVPSDEGLTVHLRRSKTDQASSGTAVGITATDPDDPLDAVAAWARWRNLLASHGLHTGPAWRGIDRYGRRPRATRLTTKSLGTIITARAAAAGLVGDYGGHSLRRGFATSALSGGASERSVQRHGRWRSPASMSTYVEEAERFDEANPTRYLRT